MKRETFRADMVSLVTELIPYIGDDYRSQDSGPDDTTPAMTLTIGADADGWAYQTGDNSYSGGAYSYGRPWAVVTLTRDCKPAAIADEIVQQIEDYEPDGATDTLED